MARFEGRYSPLPGRLQNGDEGDDADESEVALRRQSVFAHHRTFIRPYPQLLLLAHACHLAVVHGCAPLLEDAGLPSIPADVVHGDALVWLDLCCSSVGHAAATTSILNVSEGELGLLKADVDSAWWEI